MTEKMGYGCFAGKDIKKDSYLCEYCGEVTNPFKVVDLEYLYHLWPEYTGKDEYFISPINYWS
jgi:hypothetical protein